MIQSHIGVAGIFVVWAICSWFIFVYGILMYRSLGDDAEKQFTAQWGVGFGLDQASEWKDIAQTALKVALVMVVLDVLRLSRNNRWLESHLDVCAVQATLFGTAARSCLSQFLHLAAGMRRLSD